MAGTSSRTISVQPDTLAFSTSAPEESEWGQPAASQYRFEREGDRLLGQQVFKIYQSSERRATIYVSLLSSAETGLSDDIYASANLSSSSVLRTTEPFPQQTEIDTDIVIEPYADNQDWLGLAESAFSFWDNDLDARYDDL